MADLLDGLAQHLHARGLAVYDPTGVTGDLFIDTMPQTPDRAVALTGYGGGESDSRAGYDEPHVQVRARGGPDPRVSRDWAKSIRSELHGLGPLVLPDGTNLILCIALQAAPASIGKDANGRQEHVVNYRAEYRNITAHRA